MQRLLLLLSLAGCTLGNDVYCGPESGPTFEPGTYRSPGSAFGGSFPHAQAGAKVLVLEHRPDNGADVTITYQLNGKTIVERWRSSGPIPWTNRSPPYTVVALTPSTVDFGAVPVGQQRQFVLNLTNAGLITGVPEVTLSGEGFAMPTIDPRCSQLTPAATCLVSVWFRPERAGTMTATLKARIAPGPEVTSTLMGIGLPPDAGPPDAEYDASAD